MSAGVCYTSAQNNEAGDARLCAREIERIVPPLAYASNRLSRMASQSAMDLFIWLVCLVGSLCWHKCAAQEQEWKKESYPNPQLNPKECRPLNSVYSASFLCDPDGLLNPNDALELDKALQGVRDNTRCPCSTRQCSMERMFNLTARGYTISVALLKSRMSVNDAARDVVSRGRLFASYLRKSNGYGGRNFQRCEEDILILFSQMDEMVYVLTGASAQVKLSNSKVADLIQKSQDRFSTGIYFGLKDLIYNIWTVLAS